MCGCP
jgi:arylsulfatase B